MRAMVLAAGLGTRLRPLTAARPKALVEIAGRTLLEITLTRLRTFGVSDVVINVHHFPEMIPAYLKAHSNFGMRIEISREEILLDTGGGLKKAAPLLLAMGKGDEPILVHNVDVLSTIDLERVEDYHRENKALATLAVQARETSRYLLFDEKLQLCGRRRGGNDADGKPVPDEIVRPSHPLQALAFSGIHVISPRLLSRLTEDGIFSIVTSYLRLAGQGEEIVAFPADEYYWRDLGTAESLAQAERDLRGEKSRL